MITISASQLETKARCNRLWYFIKKLRLPEPKKGATTLGSVLHAVLERYLLEEPLYPQGWHTITERDGEKHRITGPEQTLVKRLVAKAIEDEIIQRHPLQQVERQFTIPVIDGVQLTGFIDHEIPGAVHDHKTAKNSKYLKTSKRDSPNYLGENLQMLTYAYVGMIEALEQGDNLPAITVRHNQFIKDKEEENPVRFVEATVSRDRLYEHFAWIQAQAAELLQLKQVKDWQSIEAPNREGACNEYGGCPFSNICGGIETVEQYTHRQASEQDTSLKGILTSVAASRPRARQKTEMSMFKSKTAKKPSAQKAEKAQASSLNPPVTKEEPETEAVEHEVVAPWAHKDCKVCKGSGLNSVGKACRSCDNYNRANQLPTSGDFGAEWDVEQGQLTWNDKPAMENEPTVAPPIKEGDLDAGDDEEDDEPENPDEVTAPIPTKTEASDEPPTPDTQEPETPKTQEPPIKKKKGGRPKQGMTLLINAVLEKGPHAGKIIALEDIIREAGESLAKEGGAESYYELDSFKRRDAMAAKAEAIVEHIGTGTVVARTYDADTRAMVAALRPHAYIVVGGVTV